MIVLCRVRGELEDAMSASISFPPPHRIAVIMSPTGRFLQCSDCKLSYVFPDGVQFGTIAKQFEGHQCSTPIRVPDWLVENIVKDDAPVPNRSLVIVRYEGKVPVMASCSKCARKFFTPTTLARDLIGATEYVEQKFDVHVCQEEIGRRL